MKQYYVFVKPANNSKAFNEVLAQYYASNKVALVNAESDVHAVMTYRDRHNRMLSPTEQSSLEAVQTSNETTLQMVQSLVLQTYHDNGIVY